MYRTPYAGAGQVGFTMTVGAMGLLWALAVPGSMSGLTFLIVTVVALGATAILFNTWRNAQPPEVIGHVLAQAETNAGPAVTLRPSRDRRAAPYGEGA